MRIAAIVAVLAFAGCSQDVTPQSGTSSVSLPQTAPASGATAESAHPVKAEGAEEKQKDEEQAEKKAD